MSIYFNVCISTSIKVSNATFIDSVSVTFFSYCAHSVLMFVVENFIILRYVRRTMVYQNFAVKFHLNAMARHKKFQ